MNDPLHDVLPRALDAEVDATYERRRATDLARIITRPRTAEARRRAPRRPLLLTALGTAGLAAAAIVVLPGTSKPERPAPPVSPKVSPSPQSVDARPFLLASARTAAAERAKSGRYWHVRERTFDRWTSADFDSLPKTGRRLIGKPFKHAWVAHTQDSWFDVRKRSSRSVLYLDPRPTFTDPAEERRWREMGSPPLTPEPVTTQHRNLYLVATLNNDMQVPLKDVPRLTADPDKLEKLITRGMSRKGRGENVFTSARELLVQPLSPKTRAALFRVLARQPGIRATPGVTDLLGRPGTALSSAVSGGGGVRDQMVIDPATARPLSTETVFEGAAVPRTGVAYEEFGWTDRVGPAVGKVVRD